MVKLITVEAPEGLPNFPLKMSRVRQTMIVIGAKFVPKRISLLNASMDTWHLAAGMKFSEKYYKNVQIHCLESYDDHAKSTWSPFKSEENGECICADGYWVTGFACDGSYCDKSFRHFTLYTGHVQRNGDRNWTVSNAISEEFVALVHFARPKISTSLDKNVDALERNLIYEEVGLVQACKRDRMPK
mmetsp:Transcript_17070/g.34369  ORF Transcript_17070/g.34369 Transcript_17070/m.34369 type:complete len:187 (+) Transcript_17070:319-879(+)